MLDILLNDFRYALRALIARPGFTAAALLTLALGIGVNAAIFSVTDAFLLRPLPYPHGDRLISIYDSYPKTGEIYGGSTIPDYLDQRAQATSLDEAAIYQYASFNWLANGVPERLIGARATLSLFPTLGTQPLLGRVFGEDEAVEGRDHVAVLSYDTWQNRFGGDRAIIGRDLHLDGQLYRIVAVMPKGFFFPDRDVELWTPYSIRPEQRSDEERSHSEVESIGLLKSGATTAQLETEFRTITERNAARSSKLQSDYSSSGFVTRATSLQNDWFGDLRKTLWLLQAMVAVVLLITAGNVANLLLVRFSTRQRDFALRSALGADRGRISRQIFIETSLLAVLGGALGLTLAAAAMPLLGRIGFAATRRWSAIDVGVGPAVFAFVLGLSLLLGLLLGALGVLSLRRAQGFDVLRAGGHAGTASQGAARVRNGLVIGQFALTLTLLVAAALLLASFHRLQKTDPGFVSANLLTARLDLPETDYADANAEALYHERLLAAVRTSAGVETAAYTSSLPFDGHLGTSGYEAEGYAGTDAKALDAERQSIDESYFATLGVPLLEGRAFEPSDTAASTPVVIVDETMARHMWPAGSALGRRIRLDEHAPWMTVIGVARAVRQNDLSEQPKRDAMYWPYRQHPARFGELVVKSSLPVAALIPELRQAALAVDSRLPLYDIQTLDERVAHSLDRRRAPTLLIGVFGALALLLAAIGIYGVLAFSAAQRTRELGVRMAIGAGTQDVLRLVIGAGMRLAVIGIALGGVCALGLGQLMRAQLYDIGATDPTVFVSMAGLLAAVALLACWLPARRAARVDPVVALRYE